MYKDTLVFELPKHIGVITQVIIPKCNVTCLILIIFMALANCHMQKQKQKKSLRILTVILLPTCPLALLTLAET